MSIKTTGNSRIDQATAEIAVALRNACRVTCSEQDHYDEAMRLRDEILAGAKESANIRRAHVPIGRYNKPLPSEVEAYLPPNYKLVRSVFGGNDPHHEIEGTDEAGWTLDGYVIPRLASGLISANEVK